MTYKIFFIFASILISLTVHQQFGKPMNFHIIKKHIYVGDFSFFRLVNALRCWRCSSDTSNGSNTAFCDDPFDENAITEQHRQWVYVECSIPPTSPNINSLLRHAVCKKLVQLGMIRIFCVLFLH